MPAKMRHCWFCGDEMGVIEDRYYERTDVCGKRECVMAARDEMRAEIEDAHRRLENDMGW